MQGQFTFTTNNGSITITGYNGPGGALSIPSATNGLPVTVIGPYALAYLPKLTSVAVPDSVMNIGPGAFYYCTSLTNIAIGNGVTNIAESAFAYCSALPGITIPNSLTRLGDVTFGFCTNLSSVTLGNNLTSIWHFAFSDCHSLVSVTIPRSVISLTDHAFDRCISLREVYFAGNAPPVDLTAFSGDTNATVYYLPGTTGWSNAFDGLPAVLWNPQVQTNDGSFGVLTNQFGFNITGNSNLVVVVEACTNLASPVWQPLQTNTLAGSPSYFSDPAWTNYAARFYRLRSP
jgi:hypothetical protein